MQVDTDKHLTDPVTASAPLACEAAATLLRSIIDSCDGQCLCFDLDSTLINNRPRNAAIMREFAQSVNEASLSRAGAEHFPTWSASNSMALLGLSTTEIERLIDPYLAFWEQRFFSSDYCAYDTAIAGASRFVRAVQASGAFVHYVTGRDEGMREGTVASLEKLSFPLPDSHKIRLSMNPTKEGSDDDFKRYTLQSIAADSEVLAGFDNEPAHINVYRQVFPQAHCIHLHTDHSMREVKMLDGIVSIMDFQH